MAALESSWSEIFLTAVERYKLVSDQSLHDAIPTFVRQPLLLDGLGEIVEGSFHGWVFGFNVCLGELVSKICDTLRRRSLRGRKGVSGRHRGCSYVFSEVVVMLHL